MDKKSKKVEDTKHQYVMMVEVAVVAIASYFMYMYIHHAPSLMIGIVVGFIAGVLGTFYGLGKLAMWRLSEASDVLRSKSVFQALVGLLPLLINKYMSNSESEPFVHKLPQWHKPTTPVSPTTTSVSPTTTSVSPTTPVSPTTTTPVSPTTTTPVSPTSPLSTFTPTSPTMVLASSPLMTETTAVPILPVSTASSNDQYSSIDIRHLPLNQDQLLMLYKKYASGHPLHELAVVELRDLNAE